MSELNGRRSRRWKQVGSLLAICGFLYTLHILLAPRVLPGKHIYTQSTQPTKGPPKNPHPKKVLQSLNLNENQCAEAFPELNTDVNRTVGFGPFNLKPVGDLGPLQVRLKAGNVSTMVSIYSYDCA